MDEVGLKQAIRWQQKSAEAYKKARFSCACNEWHPLTVALQEDAAVTYELARSLLNYD